jgi:hypothetical protein
MFKNDEKNYQRGDTLHEEWDNLVGGAYHFL